jgi:hypothetical protein
LAAAASCSGLSAASTLAFGLRARAGFLAGLSALLSVPQLWRGFRSAVFGFGIICFWSGC